MNGRAIPIDLENATRMMIWARHATAAASWCQWNLRPLHSSGQHTRGVIYRRGGEIHVYQLHVFAKPAGAQ